MFQFKKSLLLIGQFYNLIGKSLLMFDVSIKIQGAESSLKLQITYDI